jgi:hypothetical protein
MDVPENLRPLVRNLQFLQAAGALEGVAAIITTRALRVSGHLDDELTPGSLKSVACWEAGRHKDNPESLATAAALLAAEIDRLRPAEAPHD